MRSAQVRSPVRRASRLAWLAVAVSLVVLMSGIPAARSQAGPGLRVVARIPVSHPFQIAYGFGSLWVSGVGHLARIDPATNKVVADIPMPRKTRVRGGLLGIGSDSVWLSFFYLNVVKRIDPSTNKVVATIYLHAPLQPVEAGGFLWVPKHRDNTLAKIDLATNRVVGTFPIGNRHNGYDGAQFMTASGGDIWATVFSLFGVAEFDVDTETRTKVIHTFFVPGGDILLADGSVWTAGGPCSFPNPTGEPGLTCWVVRIDPDTGAITAGWRIGRPKGLAEAFGSVWVSSLSGRIIQIDPITDRRASTTRVPGQIQDLAVADGAIWATSWNLDRVVRLEPTGTAS